MSDPLTTLTAAGRVVEKTERYKRERRPWDAGMEDRWDRGFGAATDIADAAITELSEGWAAEVEEVERLEGLSNALVAEVERLRARTCGLCEHWWLDVHMVDGTKPCRLGVGVPPTNWPPADFGCALWTARLSDRKEEK